MRYSIIWLAAVLIALGLQGISGRALFHRQRGLPLLAPECVSKDCTTSINHVQYTRNLIPRIEVFKPKPPVEVVPETEETTGSNTETESDPPPQQEITEFPDTSTPGTTTQQTQQELQLDAPAKEPITKDPTLVDPGDSNSGRNAPQIFDGATYRARGITVQDNINKAIDGKTPDKRVAPAGTQPEDGSIANVFDGPKGRQDITYPDYKYTDLIGTLTRPELKLPGDTRFTVMNWDSKSLKEGRESTTVNYGGYNAEKGIIIVDDVEASNDAMTGANRLQSSSITYQSWNQVAGPSNVGNLKMVIQKNVKNLGTRQITKDAYTSKGLDLKKDTGDWAMDSADDARQQAFLALLGSDNARPTECMLTDFHNTLGNKKVTRFLTYPYEGVDVEVDDGLGWFHMVLMVGN